MKKCTLVAAVLVLLTGFVLQGTALANKASVQLEVPESAAVGEEITITVHVFHNGNNLFHHTNWAYVKINGEEVQRWEFGPFSLPESENFTRTVRYTVKGPLDIQSEAHCNIHGSAGITQKTIPLK